MQLLERVHLVQFFLFEAQTLSLDTTTAIIAPNGAGKSALLDALQIVLLGADRNRIRFNAQAGGSTRARSIRDYCLGVFRSGEDGRKRRTATTYISLVFRDQATGRPLTVGIALGASADELDHRVYGMYLLSDVALELDDHLERINGKELPLEWSGFAALAKQRCTEVGGSLELPPTSERFVKDLLFRLRAAPSAHPDVHAYRKAFQNALNLQKQEDIDLWVRTLVAENRPTDIDRFRSLLETFRQIKEKIENVAQRIETAEAVEQQYTKIEAHVIRSASYRALAAEYRRDLLSEQVERAEQALETAEDELAAKRREFSEAKLEREAAEEAHAQADKQLQGSDSYGDQAQIDALTERDRERLATSHKAVLRQVSFVRERLDDIGSLKLPGLDNGRLAKARAPWDEWFTALASRGAEDALPWSAETMHEQSRQALLMTGPICEAVAGYVRERHTALDAAQDRLKRAQQSLRRLGAGQAELSTDAGRLLNYLHEEGIQAQPVCDLVRVSDPAWQGSIEAYLRSNVEALLIPLQDEERAVRLYRSLNGARSVYGVKLALSSQARRHAERSERLPADSVAALLESDNRDALVFLQRQLGDLACVETEAELIKSGRGLTRDGLLAKGGGIERLRLPAAGEVKLGARDNRARLRVVHQDIDAADRDVRELTPVVRQIERLQSAMARLVNPDEIAHVLYEQVLEHGNARRRLSQTLDNRETAMDPDLLRLSERVRELREQVQASRLAVERLIKEEALTEQSVLDKRALLEALRGEEGKAAQRAVDAFADADVDPQRVEHQRDELDARFDTLQERTERCDERARENDQQRARLLPEAWSALAQYAKDHGIELAFSGNEWRSAKALMHAQLTWLRDTELASYQSQAQDAYVTAVETFRANVASALYDNFTKLRYQINTLNRTLRSSPAFSNNERYQFHYEIVPDYRDLYRFIQKVAEQGGADDLLSSVGEVPTAFRELIEESTSARSTITSPLDDYRRFFRFEVQIKQEDRIVGTLSERMRSGSGGEHRAPLYVIAGAALAAAYGKSDAHRGGLGLILLDEFGDKIDAQNARATVDYLRSLGLQLLLAAPDTAQGTLSGVLDSYIELFRDGGFLQAERIEVKEAARALLLSDQFDLHPELLANEAERISRENTSA